MDIFVEPVLPPPRLLILGASPVAVALAALAPHMGFAVAAAAPAGELERFSDACAKLEGFAAGAEWAGARVFVVVSTQGAGDRAALKVAAGIGAPYARVRRIAAQGGNAAAELARRAFRPTRLAAIKAPAGLDIGAITSEEIALSILAEMVTARRRMRRVGRRERGHIRRNLAMTAMALSARRPEFAWAGRVPRLRAEHGWRWSSSLAGMALPDCCLTGHHLFGAGMESFGPICRAAF